MLTGLLTGSLILLSAAAPAAAEAPPEASVVAARIVDPLEQRLAILKGLRANDLARILGAQDEEMLRAFLSEGANEADVVAAKIAEGPHSENDKRLLRLWTTLAGPDGVARASTELYPLWQQQLPQALAGVQAGLAMMGQAIAEDQNLGVAERAQMLELQFALAGWLARTDFGDRKRFEAVLGHAREWILASGVAHPLELSLTGPELRLELGARALRSARQIAGLYGLDAEAALRSVRIEKVAGDAERMTLRWSLRVLEVPLVFDEELALHEGMWMDAAHVQNFRGREDEAPPASFGLDPPPVASPAENAEMPGRSAPD
ncbi:MAG: hypothetical protein DYH17_04680 [Xanthomonadales bacterium PRO6]|nr:hypothetical protein [Xanthomonadales bacterium]MCE7930652.1 hypothetical protein [Xanthomonadales bacterium PRO6]